MHTFFFFEGICPYAYDIPHIRMRNVKGQVIFQKTGPYAYDQMIRVCNGHLAAYTYDTWSRISTIFALFPYAYENCHMSLALAACVWCVLGTIYIFSDISHPEPYTTLCSLTKFFEFFLFFHIFYLLQVRSPQVSNKWPLLLLHLMNLTGSSLLTIKRDTFPYLTRKSLRREPLTFTLTNTMTSMLFWSSINWLIWIVRSSQWLRSWCWSFMKMPIDPTYEDAAAEPKLISWVRGKQIQYDWKMVNKLLKMKFKEPNCEYRLMKTSSSIEWNYRVMLDHLELEGRDWHPIYTHIPRKLAVMDVDDILKAWTYFLHHTLDIMPGTNVSYLCLCAWWLPECHDQLWHSNEGHR